MNKGFLRYVILFVALLLLQVLICNHIALFNVAVPVIFIYLIVCLPLNVSMGWMFTIAFFMGLCVDICADTPGVNALACTLLASVRRPVYFAYVPRDDKTKVSVPSSASLGLGTYSKYLLTMVSIYCFLAFSIEYFNFANVKDIVILAASSSLLTFIILLSIDCLINSKP